MNCQDCINRLSAWVDGELSVPEADRITRHLDTCPACRRHASQLQEITTALDHLPAPSAPSTLSRQTLKAYRMVMERPGMADWWRSLNMVMRSAVCGAALGGLLCGAVLGTSLVTLAPTGSASPYQILNASEGFYP
jgi:anti-sigma factor RsiW